VRALEAFEGANIAERGLTSSIRPHYGVDQDDAGRVRQIVRDELGDEPIDLVIDDASHLLGPSRSSFDVLFPMLRPGGLFVLEDWNCQHKRAHGFHRAVSSPDSPEATRLRIALEAALEGDDPELWAKALANISARIAPPAEADLPAPPPRPNRCRPS
jgi:hypothetical protein